MMRADSLSSMWATRSPCEPGALVVVSHALLMRVVSRFPHLASSLPGAHLMVQSFVTTGTASSLVWIGDITAEAGGVGGLMLGLFAVFGGACGTVPLVSFLGAPADCDVTARPPRDFLQFGQKVLRHCVHT